MSEQNKILHIDSNQILKPLIGNNTTDSLHTSIGKVFIEIIQLFKNVFWVALTY